jgi:hypothetical protein
LEPYVFAVRYDFNAVDRFAHQSIRDAKNLNWAYQIKFIDRRQREDDDAPTRCRTLPLRIAVLSGHDGSRLTMRCLSHFSKLKLTDLAGIV